MLRSTASTSTSTTVIQQEEDVESQSVPLTQNAWSADSGGQSSELPAAGTATTNREDHTSTSASRVGSGSRMSVPVGAWRDDFWDMFRHGYCHPTVIWSCCCIPIALGQLATRLHLTWLGTSGTVSESAVAFRKLFYLVWVYWAIRAFMLYLIYLVDPNMDSVEWVKPSPAYYMVCSIDDIFSYAYLIFSAIILCNIRRHIRSKYAIPEGGHCLPGCEDCCCSLWCPCFTVAQLMRHTADYNVYGARCCSDTGVSPSAPSIV
ncbi:hypothetical protein ACA910_011886 [Epithemia clementina (nom. ined.)]